MTSGWSQEGGGGSKGACRLGRPSCSRAGGASVREQLVRETEEIPAVDRAQAQRAPERIGADVGEGPENRNPRAPVRSLGEAEALGERDRVVLDAVRDQGTAREAADDPQRRAA